MKRIVAFIIRLILCECFPPSCWGNGSDVSGRSLSEQLGLSAEEGERWIVNLIRDARLDAKIDLKEVSTALLMTVSS